MAIFQAFNPRIDAWVKFALDDDGTRILDVKERESAVPFKGIRII